MSATPAEHDWFNTYLANQDQALIPGWMKPDDPTFRANWRNSSFNAYPQNVSGEPGPLRSEVYVSLYGQAQHTSNGIRLASWLERGAQIIAPPG